jgi:hypothetical protein
LQCLQHQGQAVQRYLELHDPEHKEIMILQDTETNYPMTQHHVPENFIFSNAAVRTSNFTTCNIFHSCNKQTVYCPADDPGKQIMIILTDLCWKSLILLYAFVAL